METDKMKKCAQCGHEEPIEDFSKSYKNLCKACMAENARVAMQTMNHIKSPRMPSFYCGRGIEVPIPEDAVFINPMRFQASAAAMQGLLAGGMKRGVVSRALELADALINELKKPKDENNN